jgi:hypothetical protein
MGVTYISWAEHCSRSDHTARELGGTSHMVYWGRLGSRPATVWLKYFGQMLQTWWILIRERPQVVFVMSPPVFAPLSVWPYCVLSGRPFVIDAHTAAFLHPRWKYFQGLQHWISRQASTTIVTNEHLKAVLNAQGAHATIVQDVPVRFDAERSFPLKAAFNVAVICSFNPDEPTEEILAAAAQVPTVHFYLTGDSKALKRQSLPKNVTLTGFLSVAEYGALLRSVQVVMTLTTRDHTMLRGAWEAIYQATPVIVSDWPVLRTAFDLGAVHVDNTPESILRGILEMQQHYEQYRRGAISLREKKEHQWKVTRTALRARLRMAPSEAVGSS